MPLFSHENFYNRKDEIKNLTESIKHSLPQQILLTGCKGVGKTYLLKKMMSEMESDIICIYIDLKRIRARDDKLTIEMIFIELLKEITGLLDKFKQYDFHEITVPQSDYRKLCRFIMEFLQKITDEINEITGFLIIIDDFGMLKKDLDELFQISYSQMQRNVNYIFSGQMPENSKIIKEGLSYGKLRQITVNPFTKEETQSYLKDKLGEIKFTEDGFERFYECTRGILLYINSFRNVMDSNQTYTSEMVQETFFINMEQILIMWIKVWSGLNRNEKRIIKQLVDEDSLTWSELLKKTKLSRGTFNKYLTNLKYMGILNKQYSIEDEMLKNLVKT